MRALTCKNDTIQRCPDLDIAPFRDDVAGAQRVLNDFCADTSPLKAGNL